MRRARGFGAEARLKGGRDFRRVFKQGRKTVGRWLILWHRDRLGGNGPRLGLSVGAKVGGAVRRNRLKRLLREAFRLRRAELSAGLELVAHPRPGCPWTSRAEAESELLELLRKAGRLNA